MSLVSDEAIQKAIEELLPTVDLAKTGVKKFGKLLSKHLNGADLSSRSFFIKSALTEAINRKEESSEGEEDVEDEDDEADNSSSKKKTKGAGAGGFNALKDLSPKLAGFLNEKELSRPQIVKALWAYIKENDLQNPDNKREILLDSSLKNVFGCDKFDMFSMNKYISSHCHPFPPLDLAKGSSPTTTRSKRKTTSDKSAKSVTKKKRATGTQPPYILSQALADVLGVEQLPRPQVVSKLWEYIRAHELQNPEDKREILCDDKLKKLFENKKKVNMFSMNKFISKHLIEKVER
jgi:upstream activation factor subunit UAF30